MDAIPNPIDLQDWPLREHKDDYLLWIGRMTAEKGPHRAIAAARAAGVPLVLAGVIQPGQQAFFDREVAPHIDGERVRFVGEVGGSVKRSLFAGARALLMPIRWEEPFGMVMVEALACGTPVIAFPEGAARELVLHGQTGFLVEDEQAMGAAVGGFPASPRGIAAPGSPSTATSMWSPPPMSDLPLGGVRAGRNSRLSERTLSVLDGSTFVVGDRLGDVRADEGREHGFFCDDTRFLSRWVLRVGEAPLELLGLDQSAHFAAQFFLTPRVGPDEQAPCSVMRRRLVDHVWIEEFTVTNHLHETSEIGWC